MFRSVSDGWTLWDSVLPVEAVRLPVELAGVDRVLDHAGLLEVFRSEFSPDRGRRSIPMETYLRLMYLKWSNRWGYDRLVEIVSGSITYKVFARIPIGTPVPDASTLKHLTKRFRPDTIGELNRVLIDLGVEAGVVDVSRVRVDTTTVEANIAYPTDSGLLTKAIRQLTSNANTLTAALGLAVRVEDLRAEVVEANRELGAWARTRRPERRDEILAITDRLADLATEAGSSAARVLEAATVALAAMGVAPRRARRARNRLAQACEALPALVTQAKARAGHEPVPAATKRLSIRERDARPIKKATTPRKHIQFGYTAQIVEDTAGLIVDHQVFIGQPADAELIGPAIERVIDRCATPATVTADKTYGTTASRQALTDLGVTTVAIAYKANQKPPAPSPDTAQQINAAVRWRAGIEARVSTLKRDHGWDRIRMPNLTGAKNWLGFGVFAHNTRKLARLT